MVRTSWRRIVALGATLALAALAFHAFIDLDLEKTPSSIASVTSRMVAASSAQEPNHTGPRSGPADFTSALSMNVTVDSGQAVPIMAGLGEPSTGIPLAIGLAGLAVLGRPRQPVARRST